MGPSTLARTLSGGNQQKVVFAKWREPRPRLLLLDEPTVGVDVRAREEIYDGDPAGRPPGGAAALIVSSDLAELIELCDRISVIVDGRVARVCSRAATSGTLRRCIICCKCLLSPEHRRDARVVRMSELAAPATNPARAEKRRQWAHRLLRGERPYMLYIAFLVLLVVFSLSSPWFLSLDNFLNIGRQTTLVSIIAVGMTFVIVARQIDLSVASTLALSGMAAALAMAHVYNSWIVGAGGGPRHGRDCRSDQRRRRHSAFNSVLPRYPRHAQRGARDWR